MELSSTLGVWGRLSSLAWMVELPCPRKRHHHLAFTLHLCPSQYPKVGSLPSGSLYMTQCTYSQIHPNDDYAIAMLTYAVRHIPSIEQSASSPTFPLLFSLIGSGQ